MKTLPNCKINIGLNILSRRTDGYHNLHTVFYPIPLCDELQVDEAQADEMLVEGIPLDSTPSDNLVWRVVCLLRDKGYHVPPVRVRLTKHIPSGAGLGGGSSDAAFMMKMLNEMFSLHLSDEKMEDFLSSLGADCAVFVRNKPVFAEGIGNVFTQIPVSLAGMYLLLAKPSDYISTREAYAAVVPAEPAIQLRQVMTLPIAEWAGRLVNDFERSVFPGHPRVAALLDHFYEMGAEYASMSGSGSAVFGLFRDPVPFDDSFGDCFTFSCRLPLP